MKTHVRLTFPILVAALFCGCNPNKQSPASKQSSAGKTFETKKLIVDQSGGTIELKTGARLSIPAGAVQSPVAFTLGQVDPDTCHFAKERAAVVLECTSAATNFSKAIRISCPLPAGVQPKDASNFWAGHYNLEHLGTEVYPSQLSQISGRSHLEIETDHMSLYTFCFGETPPPSALLEIPYFNQGRSQYCWATSMQMLMEAVKRQESGWEIFNTIGKLQVDEKGITDVYLRLGPAISTLVHTLTGAYPERDMWGTWLSAFATGTPASRMNDYLRYEIGVNKHPVMIHSPVEKHAFVVVGYEGDNFIVHDPGKAPYEPKSWADFKVKDMVRGDRFVTLVIPARLAADRRTVTVNLANCGDGGGRGSLLFKSKADAYSFYWDYRQSGGFSFWDFARRDAVVTLPGDAARFNPTEIEIANSDPSNAKTVKVYYSITKAGNNRFRYAEETDSIALKPKSTAIAKFKEINVTNFVDMAAQGVSDYYFTVRVAEGGQVHDDAAFTFKMDPYIQSTAAPGLADSAWPKLQGNRRNTGIGSPTATKGDKKWWAEIGGSYSGPVIGLDNTIFVAATFDKTLSAVDEDTGQVKWKIGLGGRITGTPAVSSDGTVYIGTVEGKKLSAVYPTNGKIKWEFEAGGEIWSSPTVDTNGVVYFGAENKVFYALHGTSGREKWSFTAGSAFYGSAAIGDDGTIYFSSDKVYALNPENGTPRWTVEKAAGLGRRSPVIGPDGTVYAPILEFDAAAKADVSCIAAMDGRSGTVKWRALKGELRTMPAVALSPDGEQLYVNEDSNHLFAINRSNGAKKWVSYYTDPTFGIDSYAPAVGKDGTVFVSYNFTISDGRVCALNPATGKIKWIYNTVRSIDKGGGQVTSHFAIGENGTLYYCTAGGFLQALK